MTAIVAYKSEIDQNTSETSARLARMLGIEPGDWRIVFNGTIRGRSLILHYFDMVLESDRNSMLAPVLFLRESEINKASRLMLHKVKSDDIAATVSYVMTDYEPEAKERVLCEMSHMKIINLGPMEDGVLVSQELHNAFYDISEPEKAEGSNPVYQGTPRLFRRKNRDRTKIMQDVLESVLYMKSASITQLIYKCNLNYKSAKALLNEMLTRNLLKMVEYSSVGKRYELTDRGRKMLERLQFYVNL